MNNLHNWLLPVTPTKPPPPAWLPARTRRNCHRQTPILLPISSLPQTFPHLRPPLPANRYNAAMSMFDSLQDLLKNPIFKETRVWYDRNPGFGEQFLGLMRMLLALLLLLMFVLMGGDFFQNVYARDLALQAREISPCCT